VHLPICMAYSLPYIRQATSEQRKLCLEVVSDLFAIRLTFPEVPVGVQILESLSLLWSL
jgi:hypothetical protein